MSRNNDAKVAQRLAELTEENILLRNKISQFEAVYNHHYQLTGLLDTEGRLILENTTALNFVGLKKDELNGKLFVDTPFWAHSKDEQDKLGDAIKRVLKGEFVRFETTHVSASGETRNIDFCLSPVFDVDGKVIYMVPEGFDITERKRANEAIRESQATFKALVENSNDAIMRFDREHRHLYVNPAAESMVGIKPGEFIGKTHKELGFPYDLVLQWTSAIDYVFSTGKTHRIEFSLPNGNWIDWLLSPEFTDDGEVIAVITSARDITGHKQAEKAKFESLARFSGFAEASQYGMGMADLDGNIVYVNNTLVHMIGEETSDDCIGKHFPTAYYPPIMSRKLTEEVIPALMKKGNWHGELEIVSVGGRRIPTDENYFIIRDEHGEPMYFADILTDISNKKNAEDALKASEEKYRTFFQNSADAMLLLQDDKFTDCNVATLVMLGLDSMDEFFSITPWELSPEFQPDGRKSEEKAHEMISIAHNLGAHRFEWCHRRKNGSTFPVEVSLTAVPSEKGTVLLCVWRDLTEQKNAEAERHKLQEQLNQSQKMEAVGRLAGGVAHDFNNMLGAIIGYTELILDEIDSKHSMYADLLEIHKAASRSTDLTRQLLAFARKQTITQIEIDLNETIADSLKMLQRLIGEDINLVWKPGKDLWMVKMDPSQIDQILANLSVNARDAIEDVGTYTIETGNTAITSMDEATDPDFEPGEYVYLAVSDNGCGMIKETRDNIFEPFFTTKELGHGTGLGLSTVYGIVKQNNGFINVYSEPGKGTTFKIFIPRLLKKDTEKAEKETMVTIARGSETVLLVEDETATRNVTSKMLSRLGYTVLTASTPDEAIALAAANVDSIKLVITDVIMPGMNGRTLIDRLKTDHPQFKSLFMSGYTADIIAHHGVLDEGINFIQKPLSMRMLSLKIRDILDKQ